jgi:hypothetical protein
MPWKLYVDSRKRQAGARRDTDTDFAISLPHPITVRGKCYIDCFLAANSFYTVRAGDCDRIYLDELAAQTKRVVTLPAGQYNVFGLRDALVTALNTNKAITGQYRCTYETATNRLKIDIVNPNAADQFRIWPEAYLKTNWSAWSGTTTLAQNDLKSANAQCGFFDSALLAGTNTVAVTAPQAPDVQPYKQLFIRSNLGGGSQQSLGVNGETDIIRRVVVGNTPQNGMIYDVHSQSHDYITIHGNPEYSQFWFQIIDIDGRTVDTHGLPTSFSILFVDIDD